MFRMFQLPQASAELCFKGGEIYNTRADYPEVVIWADRSGISVVVPDCLSEEDIDDIAFYLTAVLGFEELDEETIRKRPCCKVIPCARGFLLTPDMLRQNGQNFLEVSRDLEGLQRKFNNELNIFIQQDGSFLVCLPNNLSADDLLDETNFLVEYLEVTPRIVDLRKCS